MQNRVIKPPNRFGYADVIYCALNIGGIDHDKPCSYEETMNWDDRDECKREMQQEMDSLVKNETRDLT